MHKSRLFAVVAILTSGGIPVRATASDLPRPKENWKDMGVVETSASPHARLHAVPVRAVRMRDGFWLPRMEAARLRGIPRLLGLLEEHGVVDNFRRISGRKQCERRGPYFTDSDLYKWMEAAAFVLQWKDDPAVREMLDKVIDEVVAIQNPDGYLNTYFVDERKDKRFSNLAAEHELYCAGHLFQAAVAHYRATGHSRLLGAALKYADYLTTVFGPGRIEQADGHPEVEMALVELYRTTGRKEYLDLAGFFLDLYRFAARTQIEGHAVRAAYLCCGGADYYMETGKQPYWEAADRMWQDMTGRKLYITGGIGATSHGEAFGAPFDLPNATSYAETCAGIASGMWNWRMLAATGQARFADEMERVLYNGFLSGVSLEGSEYFYVNPLESAGGHKRRPWYDCTCCPPNVLRMLASLPGYIYSTSREGLWVHLYDNNELTWRLEDGRGVRVVQETKYPWEGGVTLTIQPDSAAEFSVFVRIPGWCVEPKLRVNGQDIESPVTPGTYCYVRRSWTPGDRLELDLPMPVVVQTADPRVRANLGRVAITRGPLVYCFESVDNPGVNVLAAAVPVDAKGEVESRTAYRADLLGGVTVVSVEAVASDYEKTSGGLYRPTRAGGMPKVRRVHLHAIPYYAWCNRGDSQMVVWVPFMPKD